jgi:hypothetical protein
MDSLHERAFQRQIVLEKIVGPDDGEGDIKFPQRALNYNFGGKVRNILELICLENGVINDVLQLAFLGEAKAMSP